MSNPTSSGSDTLVVDPVALQAVAAKVNAICDGVRQTGAKFETLAEAHRASAQSFNDATSQCIANLKSAGDELGGCTTSLGARESSVQQNFKSSIAAPAFYEALGQVRAVNLQVNTQLGESTAQLQRTAGEVTDFYTSQAGQLQTMGEDVKTNSAAKLDAVKAYLDQAVTRFSGADAAGGH